VWENLAVKPTQKLKKTKKKKKKEDSRERCRLSRTPRAREEEEGIRPRNDWNLLSDSPRKTGSNVFGGFTGTFESQGRPGEGALAGGVVTILGKGIQKNEPTIGKRFCYHRGKKKGKGCRRKKATCHGK